MFFQASKAHAVFFLEMIYILFFFAHVRMSFRQLLSTNGSVLFFSRHALDRFFWVFWPDY